MQNGCPFTLDIFLLPLWQSLYDVPSAPSLSYIMLDTGKAHAPVYLRAALVPAMHAYRVLLGLIAVAGHGLSCHAFMLSVPALSRPALCLRLSAPPGPSAQTGEQIFSANCAVCHASGHNAIVADRTLKKTAIEKYLMGGFNEKAVAYQVKNGKNAMPVYAERLSEAEIGLVAAYVIKSASDGWD